MVKNLPAMLETWIWSLGRKDPLEKEMATDSSILAWRRKWLSTPVFLPGEGNGYWIQYSCLENSMDRGAWWATVHGVAKESDMTEWLIALYILTEPKMKWVSFHASFHPFLICYWKRVLREASGRSPGPEESGEAGEPSCLSIHSLNVALVGYGLSADDSCISLLFLAYGNERTAFSFYTFLLLETIS